MNEINVYKNHLYQKMSESTLDNAIEIFIENFELMNGVKIIFTDNEKGYNPIEPFMKEYDIRAGVLSTPFRFDKFYLISQKVGFNASLGLNTRVGYFYDISLDTNMVSYVDKNYRGKELSPELIELSMIFTKKRKLSSSMSADPYICENTFFKDEIPQYVDNTLYNFFYSLYQSHTKLPLIAKLKTKRHIKSILNHRKTDDYKIPKEILEYRYKIIYLMMLKMFEISLKNVSYNTKVKEIINFSNNEINKLMFAELILALEFFDKGNKIRFFGKLQKNNPNIIRDIKNLSWDVFHLRSLEMNMMFVKHKKADITVPLLFSRDNRFNEIRSFVKLKMIVLDYAQGNYIPFYENDIVQKKIKELNLDESFTREKYIDRYESFSFEAVDKLIKEIEQRIRGDVENG